MEKIFQIILKKVDVGDLHKFFNIHGAGKPDPIRFDNYFVKLFDVDTSRIVSDGFDQFYFGVFDSEKNLLGIFRINEYSNKTIIYFFIEDKKHMQAFLVYINSIRQEMKLHDFKILDAHVFGEDNKTIDGEEIYIPKTEAARKKWRDIYKCIVDYVEELSESDDDEIFVPKLEDYCSRIISELNIKISTKTISRIKMAGDAGLLGNI